MEQTEFHIDYARLGLDGNQINLWTYWQGYQIKDIDIGVDILLVGQDRRNDKRINVERSGVI